MVKSLKGWNTVTKDSKRNLNIESDCEGDSTGAGLETSEAGVKIDETQVVLITGSFSAYVGFLTSPQVDKSFEVGSPCSSIAARTLSCSLPSNRKVSIPARNSSVIIPWKMLLRARRRVYMF